MYLVGGITGALLCFSSHIPPNFQS